MRLLFFLPLLLGFYMPSPAHAFPAEVLSVHDGDSITARRVGATQEKPHKVRIYGIDCPELGQPFGEEARDLAKQVLDGKTVEIVPAQKGKSYRREVGRIVLVQDMLVVQDALVSAGLAWVDDRFCKLPVCELWRLHQREARAARRGLGRMSPPCPVDLAEDAASTTEKVGHLIHNGILTVLDLIYTFC